MDPEPFGDDDLVAARHDLATVHRRVVPQAVYGEVVPQQCHAGLRRYRVVDPRETRGAAFEVIIEVDHESPGAVAAHAREALVVVRAGLEGVPVRLELLAQVIALRLDAFGIFGAD